MTDLIEHSAAVLSGSNQKLINYSASYNQGLLLDIDVGKILVYMPEENLPSKFDLSRKTS